MTLGSDAVIHRDEQGRAVALSFSSGSTEPVPNHYEAPAGVATPNRGIVGAIPCAFCGAPVNPKGRGKDPRRFCDARCRSAEYARTHPRVALGQAPLDFTVPVGEPCPALSGDASVRAMVLAVLADGQEHEPSDFCRASGLTWARINPRLRDCRKPQFGGHLIDCRLREQRSDGTKVYVYRLVVGSPAA